MNHVDHVRLIENGILDSFDKASGKTPRWADFGSGRGAFTLALRDVLGEKSEIFSIDQDKSSLEVQREVFEEKFPGSKIHFLHADMTNPIDFPVQLDGILAANSLHFVKDKIPVLKLWKTYLKPSGRLIFVEYNVDHGNMWVPYPFSFESLKQLARESGLSEPRLLEKVPSQFLDEIYSAEVKI